MSEHASFMFASVDTHMHTFNATLRLHRQDYRSPAAAAINSNRAVYSICIQSIESRSFKIYHSMLYFYITFRAQNIAV